jgi:hypothetical protein
LVLPWLLLSLSLAEVALGLMTLCFLDLLHGAAFFLMLGHVPLWDVLFTAERADKWAQALVLSHVHIEVGTSVVFFITAFICAMELVHVLVGFFVISQDPMLSELWEASWIWANELFVFFFFMSGHVVGQMLRHLEALCTTSISALMEPDCQVTLQMLPQFWSFLKLFFATRNRAFKIIQKFLAILANTHKILV